MNKIGYRRDIDGLRAIAVLSVILHHLNASLLPGGFIGVDIFFVISGYLITSHIIKEIDQGTFSYSQFYKRRINRILPALVTVIVTSTVLGFLLLSPADLVLFVKSAIYSMTGVSNIFFWQEYGNYFAGNAREAPLLHTWSLAVEEQFYVFWPLFVIILFKLSRRHMGIVLAMLTIGAILLSEIGVGYAVSASYYLLPTRFFELMIGGLLALIVLHWTPEKIFLSRLCFFLGLLLISFSLFWLDKSSSFPGFNAIWPCLGAALLIFAGSAQDFSSKILMNKPMVFIGLISYSLYLWHWPIIAYLNYVNIPIGPMVGVSVVSTSIVLAWISWKFVEVPFRQNGATLTFPNVFLMRFVMPGMVIFMIGLVVTLTSGLSNRFDPQVAEFEQALAAKPEIMRAGCHVPNILYSTKPDLIKCKLGKDKSIVDGILIGDSYANHFTGMLDVMAKAEGITIMDYTMDGCLPILGHNTGRTVGYAERCKKRNETAYRMVKENHFERVILAGSWPNTAETRDRLIDSINDLLNMGAKVTLIINNVFISRADSCPIRKIMYETKENCKVPMKDEIKYFQEIQALFPSVHIIDPNQVICNGEICSPTKNGILLYRDAGHLNDIGSRAIGKELLNIGITLSQIPPTKTKPMAL